MVSGVFGEQPSAAKWNILGTNDASFNDGTGIGTSVIDHTKVANGAIVQVVSTGYSSVATGTTVIPQDDTIPQNTEGDEYMTQAITPKSATNILVIRATVFLASTVASQNIAAALFQDTTANALAVQAAIYSASANKTGSVVLEHRMVAGTTSSTTFKIRAGGSAAGTTTFNGSAGARLYGAIPKSSIVVEEYKSA